MCYTHVLTQDPERLLEATDEQAETTEAGTQPDRDERVRATA